MKKENFKGHLRSKQKLSSNEEREKCIKTSHYRPQCAKWFSRYSISKSGIGQDGYRHFVVFQPNFQLNMTSQTQYCKTMKK